MNSEKILHNSLLKNTPNLLLHGKSGYDQLLEILHSKYQIKNERNISNMDLNYYQNNIYYEFNIQSITTKHYKKFLEIIYEIVMTDNSFIETNYKIIIFKNFDRIKQSLQNMLRVILEKYRQTTIFIVITSKYDSVIDPIRSRFLCIRFPRIKDKVKRKILYQEIKPPKISEKYYDFIYTLEDKNEIELSFEVKKEIESYIDPHLITSRRIIKIYEKNKITKKYYEDLKNLSYHVIKFNLEIPKFYKIFLSELLKKQSIRDKQKFKLIQLFADSEYNYNKSYRSIIVLESLLFNVYNLCY